MPAHAPLMLCSAAAGPHDVALAFLLACCSSNVHRKRAQQLRHHTDTSTAPQPHSLTGMMPILHSPGLMMPGQLGPIRRVLLCSLMIFFTLT